MNDLLSLGARRLSAPGNVLGVIFLVGAWCALWRSFSLANVLSGLIVGVIATAAFGADGRIAGIRPRALGRLVLLIGRDLINSTVEVANEVLTPTDYTDELFLDVALAPEDMDHLLLLTVAVTLTPGTAVVDINPTNNSLRVHLLHAEKAVETIDHILELAHLATEALPVSPAASRT